jgi:hypothetical protein
MTYALKRALVAFVVTFSAFCFLNLVGAGDASAGRWKRKSQEHYDQCNAWCASQPDVCTHCSTLRGCGEGFDTIKSWTGYGKNWHACKKRPDKKDIAEQAWSDCGAWCQENRGACYACRGQCESMHGLTSVKRWGDRGIYIHACGKKHYRDPASNFNRDGCFRYCDGSAVRCSCSANKHCGYKSVAIRSWKGKGKNFHACAGRKSIKTWNKTRCVEWCADNPDTCVECKPNKNCGKDLSHLRSFKLGSNTLLDYHACKRRQGGGARLGESR